MILFPVFVDDNDVWTKERFCYLKIPTYLEKHL